MKQISVNKIGGANMSKLDQVLQLVRTLKSKGESPVLVVSAFKGVTDKLVEALDNLNGKDYSFELIKKLMEPARALVMEKIDEFFKDESWKEQAKLSVNMEFQLCCDEIDLHQIRMKADQNNGSDFAIPGTQSEEKFSLFPSTENFSVRDKVIAFGERSVVNVLEFYLKENGINSLALRDAQFNTDIERENGSFSKTEIHKGIQKGLAEAVKPHVNEIGKTILIIGGHVRNVLRGMTVEIGRSYTDTTAVDTALALERILELPVARTVAWKEVDGVASSDPRQLSGEINTPIIHSHVSLREAMELAGAGSQLMQIDSLALAKSERISLGLRNIEKPQEAGTVFTIEPSFSKYPFKIVTHNKKVGIVTFKVPEMATRSGFVGKLIEPFNLMGININDILTEGTSISFTINLPPDLADQIALKEKISQARTKLQKIQIEEEIFECKSKWEEGKANVVVIGDEMKGNPGILSAISAVLANENINIEGITHDLSQRKVSIYTEKKDADRAVQTLHRIFIDRDRKYATRLADAMKLKILKVINAD